jgi:hypothetical protein
MSALKLHPEAYPQVQKLFALIGPYKLPNPPNISSTTATTISPFFPVIAKILDDLLARQPPLSAEQYTALRALLRQSTSFVFLLLPMLAPWLDKVICNNIVNQIYGDFVNTVFRNWGGSKLYEEFASAKQDKDWLDRASKELKKDGNRIRPYVHRLKTNTNVGV